MDLGEIDACLLCSSQNRILIVDGQLRKCGQKRALYMTGICVFPK